MKAKDKERQDAIDKLHQWIKPGDVITTVMRHVARSGMQRSISLTIPLDGEVFALDYYAARAMDDNIDRKNGGIKIGGCGMDMGFALVYNLARTLWPDGYGCIGEKCRSNDHSNGDRDRTPDPMPSVLPADRGPDVPTHWHNDGGYSLMQRWL